MIPLIDAAMDLGKTIVKRLWREKASEKELKELELEAQQIAVSVILQRLQTDARLAETFEKTVRRSWMSRHTRPVISWTFHFFFWFTLWFDFEKWKVLVNTVIAEWGGLKITIGFLYTLIVFTYFWMMGREIIQKVRG